MIETVQVKNEMINMVELVPGLYQCVSFVLKKELSNENNTYASPIVSLLVINNDRTKAVEWTLPYFPLEVIEVCSEPCEVEEEEDTLYGDNYHWLLGTVKKTTGSYLDIIENGLAELIIQGQYEKIKQFLVKYLAD